MGGKRPPATPATSASGKTIASKALASASVKTKGALAKPKAASKPGTSKKKLVAGMKFPGKPLKPADPIIVGKYKLYTDINMQAWRVKKIGERVDKACSWKVDPAAAWEKVLKILK